MPTNDKDFLIRVRADIQQALADLRKLPAGIDQTTEAARRQAESVSRASQAVNGLQRTFGVIFSVETLRRIIQTADTFQALNTRIKTATASTGDFAEVSRELLAISNRNGVALQQTVGLFQNLARAAPELGATNREVLKVVEAVEQLAVISGAQGANLTAGLTQLSQGLASGTLRAEELNSILENTPEIASRIARGLGVSVGEMRRMVIEGRVASREVFEALLKQAPEIAREFGDIPVTFERGLTSLQNSLGNFIRVVDTAANGTSRLGRFLQDTADFYSAWAAELEAPEIDRLNFRLNRLVAELNRLRDDGFAPTSEYFRVVKREIEETEKRIASLQKKIQDAPTVAPTPKPTSPAQIAADQQLTKQIERFRQLTQTVGETSEAQVRYLLTTAEVTQGQDLLKEKLLQAARAYDQKRAAIDREREVKNNRQADEQRLRDLEEEIRLTRLSARERAQAEAEAGLSKDATPDQRQRARDLAGQARDANEARRLLEQTRTPAENLSQEFANLSGLLDRGAIDWDTYSRAVFDAQDRFEELTREVGENTNEMTEFGKQAARGLQQAFADEFFNVMQGNFDDLGESFTRLLQRLAAELLASEVLKFLTGDFAKTGQLGGVLGSIGASLFHSGGVVGAGGAQRNVSPLAFVAAPRLHAGNLGLKRDEYPAILQEGEGVLSRAQMQALGDAGPGAGAMRVVVENRGTPKETREARFDPEQMVVRIMLDDVQRGGPISAGLGRAFNLQRGGR